MSEFSSGWDVGYTDAMNNEKSGATVCPYAVTSTKGTEWLTGYHQGYRKGLQQWERVAWGDADMDGKLDMLFDMLQQIRDRR
jgi:hypothetical protein